MAISVAKAESAAERRRGSTANLLSSSLFCKAKLPEFEFFGCWGPRFGFQLCLNIESSGAWRPDFEVKICTRWGVTSWLSEERVLMQVVGPTYTYHPNMRWHLIVGNFLCMQNYFSLFAPYFLGYQFLFLFLFNNCHFYIHRHTLRGAPGGTSRNHRPMKNQQQIPVSAHVNFLGFYFLFFYL